MQRRMAPLKVCPVCNGKFMISTALDEKQFCSLACEAGDPHIIYREKRKKVLTNSK